MGVHTIKKFSIGVVIAPLLSFSETIFSFTFSFSLQYKLWYNNDVGDSYEKSSNGYGKKNITKRYKY